MKKIIISIVAIACFTTTFALPAFADDYCDATGGYARYSVPYGDHKGIFVTGVKQAATGYLEAFLYGKASVSGNECSRIRFQFCSGSNLTSEAIRNMESVLLTAMTTGMPIRANIIGIDTSEDRCYANTIEIVRNPEE